MARETMDQGYLRDQLNAEDVRQRKMIDEVARVIDLFEEGCGTREEMLRSLKACHKALDHQRQITRTLSTCYLELRR